MKNLKAKPFALVLFVVFGMSFLLMTIVSGKPVKDVWTALWTAYKTIPLLLAIASLFVLYGWRWRIFRGWLVPFPDLNGTWQGNIQTTWKNPETGQVPGPVPAILTIRQSFISISCVMRTAEMTSRSYFADFWIDKSQQIRRLGYCYHSSPSPLVQHRSSPHDGTIVFEVIGNPAEKLSGVYWSSRNTAGEVALTFRTRDMLEEFPSDLGTHPVSGRP